MKTAVSPHEYFNLTLFTYAKKQQYRYVTVKNNGVLDATQNKGIKGNRKHPIKDEQYRIKITQQIDNKTKAAASETSKRIRKAANAKGAIRISILSIFLGLQRTSISETFFCFLSTNFLFKETIFTPYH